MSSPAQRRAATSLAMTASNSGLHVPLPPDVMVRSLGEVYANFRTAGFGADLKRRILLGTDDLTAEYATHTLLPQDMTSDHMRPLAAHSTTTLFCKPTTYSSAFSTTLCASFTCPTRSCAQRLRMILASPSFCTRRLFAKLRIETSNPDWLRTRRTFSRCLPPLRVSRH